MLSMSAMSSGQASYYLGLAAEDYYLKGGEPQGIWFGEGAQNLGLSGFVLDDQLYNLFDGLAPDGSRPLVQLQRHEGKAEHRPGWDLTFSAPKSVSVLWSQASSPMRNILQSAHLAGVKAALDYLQDTAAFSRVGKEGKRFERSGLVVALFEHSTSRALDPQLHTHALLMNIGVGEDGRTRTISSLSLFQAKMAAGALYRTELSAQLERSGIRTEKHRTWFEVPDVSEQLIDLFSKRRKAIEAALLEKGFQSPEAAAVAAIETRDVKEAVSRAALFDDWHTCGADAKWVTRQADSLFNVFRPTRDQSVELATAAMLATEHITASQAHFTARDFVRFMAEQAQCTGLGAAEVVAGAGAYLQNSNEIVRLGFHYGEERFTTREMLELEERLLSATSQLFNNRSHEVSADTVVRGLASVGTLSEEQLKAVWHITAQTGGVAVVSGMAGTGKTRMLETAKDIWEAAGYHVVGAALAAKAGEQLEQGADIESGTIARLLLDIEKGRSHLNAKTVLVIDEAGMVATPEMEKLARHCMAKGAKLVLVGDERQLQPIGPGAPFMELGVRFGQAELQDIRRQNEAWARRAVKDIAEGNAQDAIEEFIARGLVHIADTRDEAIRELVSQWKADGLPLDETLIIAGTRIEVSLLNSYAQAERLKAGDLDADFVRRGEVDFYVGDRVLFTANHKAMGVLNGDAGHIKAITEHSARMTVRLDSGEQVTFEVEAMPDFALGYASTTHRAQGSTSLNTYILAGGSMQDRELSYVQASRAREKTAFFMTRLEAGDEISRLAREMERSRQKEMAHTVIRETDEHSQDRDR